MASFTCYHTHGMDSDVPKGTHVVTYPPETDMSTARPVERERVRVSRACDRCKTKKIRCTGKKPCALCSRLSLDCQFNARYTRGRLPPIEVEEPQFSNGIGLRQEPLGDFGAPPTPASNDRRRSSLYQSGTDNPPMPQDSPEYARNSQRNSPTISQAELRDHYVGPSSGVSFLLRVQRRLHKIDSPSSRSSIFTFGDSPLTEHDSSFFVPPPREYAQEMIARYFDFAVPTHRFLHRPSVEACLEELYGKQSMTCDKRGGPGKRALLLMVFAQAQEYMSDSGIEADCSNRYFQAAEHQLRAETGQIRLTSVQARLCQCFYLLSESRINHCWSLFGTTAHLLLALGLHRRRNREPSKHHDMVDSECRKRVFWCAYTLDNYLSAALGRPRTFHDDDIDQELPALLSDDDLNSTHLTSMPGEPQNIMQASVHHARLAQLISGILKDLYGIRSVPAGFRSGSAMTYHYKLSNWREEIADFLDGDPSPLSTLFQRQRNVLRLAYAHALILVHRPFLLSNFENLIRRNPLSRTVDVESERNVSECLNAAMSIVSIMNELCEGGQMFRAFWFTQYYAFCAVVVLYVYIIQRHSDTDVEWRAYYQAAEKCQRQLSSFTTKKDSFAERYSIVLQELQSEAMNQTKHQVKNHVGKGERVLDSDNDTEVARTILRLSDNNHLDSNNVPHNGSHRYLNTINNIGGGTRSQPSVASAFSSFSNFPQTVPPDLVGMHFSQGMASTNSATFVGDTTGWGIIDSWVTAGITDQEPPYIVGNDALNSVNLWNFTGVDHRITTGHDPTSSTR